MTESRVQRARDLFSRNYNCAQSVFAGCGTGECRDEAQRLALTAAFGGGVAGQGEICGAVTGALLALGEAGGEAMGADPAAGRNAVNVQAQHFLAAFKGQYGSVLCRELTGCSLNCEAGLRAYREKDLRQTLCDPLVMFAVDHVDRTIGTATGD